MVPSAIRRTADLSPDSAEVEGALTHDSIPAAELASGRFDGAAVEIGVVDWQNLDRAVLYRGEIGSVSEQAGSFSAELRSAKADLEADTVPRTSPTCRARFCGPGCTLSVAKFTHAGQLASFQAGAWIYVTPRDGLRALDKSTGQDIRFVSSWQRPVSPAAPAGGTTVDAEARTAITDLVAALAAGGFFAAP